MNTYRQLEAIVDIGTSKVVVLIGYFAPDRKVEIVGYGESESEGIHRGVIMNSHEAANAIKMAIRMAQQGLDAQIKSVTVGINGHKLHSTIVPIEKTLDPQKEITSETLQSIVKDAKTQACQGGEIAYHASPISFILNEETFINNPIGYTGKTLSSRYHVITGPMDYQNMVLKTFEILNLHVEKIVVHPAILGKYCLSKDEKEMGSAVVDFGCGVTTISIYFKKHLYHTSTIPFGSEVVTSDIKEGFQIINEYAERLKTSHGSITSLITNRNIQITLPQAGDIKEKDISIMALSEVIEARLQEINEALVYQMEKYDLIEKMGAGIVMSGGGANLRGMQNLLSFDTGKEVRIFSSNQLVGSFANKLNSPQYITAINLMCYTLERAEKEKRPKKNIEQHSSKKEKKEKQEKEKEQNRQIPFLKKYTNKILQFLEDDSDELN